MARKWDSVLLTGLLLTALITGVLVFRPPSRNDSYINIDTQLQGASAGVKAAKLKLSLNEQRYLDNFPRQLDGWQGVDDSKTQSIEDYLQADSLIIRTYTRQTLSQPMFLVVVHSKKHELSYSGSLLQSGL